MYYTIQIIFIGIKYNNSDNNTNIYTNNNGSNKRNQTNPSSKIKKNGYGCPSAKPWTYKCKRGHNAFTSLAQHF